jgi:hypothetical protein
LNFIAAEHTSSCPCNLSDGIIANGKEEMVVAVRNEIKYGSDWIKLLVTGAITYMPSGRVKLLFISILIIRHCNDLR